MKWPKILACGLILVAAAAVLGGCAASSAEMCRRDPLVHPEVRFDDTSHRTIVDEHVFFSKEGSSGGQGVGGGGCGCN